MPDRREFVNGDNCVAARQSEVGQDLCVFDRTSLRLFDLSINDGRVLWQTGCSSVEDVLAVSADGQEIVLRQNDSAVVWQAPLHSTVKLAVGPDDEIRFCMGGTHIVALPRLQRVKLNEGDNTELMARPKNVLCILNIRQGTIDRAIALEK
ncbi:MAG TPA: hypothetical protein VMD30_14500 [Tepidisphaeraceae bacterium]|nr:hypothetical protein [Tepidisphaeraceae bacterium]